MDAIYTTLHITGQTDDIDEFVEELSDAGGDLSLVLYRTMFPTKASTTPRPARDDIDRLVGPAAYVLDHSHVDPLEGHDDNTIVILRFTTRHALSTEAVTVAALHNFCVSATFTNTDTDEVETLTVDALKDE